MKHRKPLTLEFFLPYRLSLLSNTVSGMIADTYADKFGITMPEWRIMMILAEYPGSSADEVCRRTQIEKSVVSRAVARLKERRLITRSMSDTDRRRSILDLSETGMSVYDEVMPVAKSYEEQLLKGFSRQQKLSLDALLDALQRRADSMKQSQES